MSMMFSNSPPNKIYAIVINNLSNPPNQNWVRPYYASIYLSHQIWWHLLATSLTIHPPSHLPPPPPSNPSLYALPSITIHHLPFRVHLNEDNLIVTYRNYDQHCVKRFISDVKITLKDPHKIILTLGYGVSSFQEPKKKILSFH